MNATARYRRPMRRTPTQNARARPPPKLACRSPVRGLLLPVAGSPRAVHDWSAADRMIAKEAGTR
jgi:hypothetical protein